MDDGDVHSGGREVFGITEDCVHVRGAI
jgi:hypothetical protein